MVNSYKNERSTLLKQCKTYNFMMGDVPGRYAAFRRKCVYSEKKCNILVTKK